MIDPQSSWLDFVREFRAGAHADYGEHWQLFQKLSNQHGNEGPFPVWWPGQNETVRSNLAGLCEEVGVESYGELHRWSVQNREVFWQAVLDRLQIRFAQPPQRVLDLASGVENPIWLGGARYNIVDSCFQAPADSPAIVCTTEGGSELEQISYAQLEARVNRVANGLREHGIGPDQPVVLFMPMTIDCVAAYLGVVRAGGRVVSVADSFAAGELRKRMAIAAASVVITVDRFSWAGRHIELYSRVREAIEPLESPVRCIVLGSGMPGTDLRPGDLTWERFLSDSDSFGSETGPAERVTNVLFSSGTTGVPKAIPWTHLTPIKCAMDGHFHQNIQPGDVIAWPTNIGWMMGPWLIYASLLNRACMALYVGAPNVAAFTDFVSQAGVTMLGVVPALVRTWRANELVGPDAWPNIKAFSSTGEVSNPEDYLWLMSRAGYRAPVIEYLGGTEIGGGHITGSVLRPASPSTFNTPALGLDFVLLDESGARVPAGELGELYLIPPSIGLSQTLLNADHHQIYYEACPAGPDGEVLRRHGDEFVALPDGTYRAQGRSDDTMNLGGIKVSSIEIEEVLNQHPAVFESAAIAVAPSGGGAERLVVYVVPHADADAGLLSEELQRRLASELNPMFRIHQVVEIEALPRTASNKVMRRELRDRYRQI